MLQSKRSRLRSIPPRPRADPDEVDEPWYRRFFKNPEGQPGIIERSAYGIGRGIRNVVGTPYDMLKAALLPPNPEDPSEVAASFSRPGGFTCPPHGCEAGSRADREARNAESTSEAVGHGLAAALPGVGPWAAGLGERAGAGDIAGAATELVTTLGVPKAIAATGAIPKTAEFIKRQIPGASLDPTMAMTKAIKRQIFEHSVGTVGRCGIAGFEGNGAEHGKADRFN